MNRNELVCLQLQLGDIGDVDGVGPGDIGDVRGVAGDGKFKRNLFRSMAKMDLFFLGVDIMVVSFFNRIYR